MKSFVGKLFSVENIKLFYESNSETLLKRCKRSKIFSILLLLVEQYNYFALIVNEDVVELLKQKSFQMGQLGYISWANLDKKVQKVIIYIQLSLNAFIIAMLLSYYILYCIKKFEFKKSRILSFLIQTFNFQLIPGVYFSVHHNGIIGYVNLIFCLIVSLLYIYHSNNNYYKIEDFSSRKQNNMEYVKLGATFIMIISISQLNIQLMYLVSLLISLISIFQFSKEMSFYFQPLNRLFISFSFFNFFSSCIFLLHIHDSEQKWLIQGLLFIFALCFKLGEQLYKYRQQSIFQSVMDSSDQRLTNISSIELVARHLLSYQNQKKQVENEKSIFMNQIDVQIKSSDKKQNINDFEFDSQKQDKQFLIDSIFTDRDFNDKKNLDTYICSLYENYFSSRKSICIRDYGYLFYLLEKSHNFPKLLVRIAEIKRRKNKNLSLNEKSALNYILYKQKRNKKTIQQQNQWQQNQLNSYISTGSLSNFQNQDTENLDESNNKLDLNQIFIYEQKLSGLTEKILQCTSAKMEILKCIGQDRINLSKLLNLGQLFYKLRQEVEKEIFDAIEQCGSSINLNVLQQYFCYSLCQDQLGFQEKLRQKIRHSLLLRQNEKNGGGNNNNKNLNPNQNVSSYKTNQIITDTLNDFNSNFINGNGKFCVVFVSLMMENLGKIKATSNQFKDVTGFDREEVVGQNISMLQPVFVGEHHNQYLRDFTERGTHSERSLYLFNTSLFLRKKDGFCVSIELITQMHINQITNEAGLIGQISHFPEQHDSMIIFDLSFLNKNQNSSNQKIQQSPNQNLYYPSLQIDCCSSRIFQDIFSGFCDSLHSLKKYSIDDFIPIFSSFLIPQIDESENNIHEFNLSTIAFFPKNSDFFNVKQGNEKKTLMHSATKDSAQVTATATTMKNKKRTFEIENNDLYIIDVGVTVFNDSQNNLKIGMLKFRTYRLIENEDEKKYMLELKLAPQLEDMCGFNREGQTIIQFLDRNQLNKAYQSQPNLKCKKLSSKIEDSNMLGYSLQTDVPIRQTSQNRKDSTLIEVLERGTAYATRETEYNLDNTTQRNLNTIQTNHNNQNLIQIMRNATNQIKHSQYFINSMREMKEDLNQNYQEPIFFKNTSFENDKQNNQNSGEIFSSIFQPTTRRFLNLLDEQIPTHEQINLNQLQSTRDIVSRDCLYKDFQSRENFSKETLSFQNLDKDQKINYQGISTTLDNIYDGRTNYHKNSNLDLYVKSRKQTLQTLNFSQREVSSEPRYLIKENRKKTKPKIEQELQLNYENLEFNSKTGSKSSSSVEVNRNIKKSLILKIKNNKYTPISLTQMKIMIYLFFFSSVLYVLINQLQLSNLFEQQKKAFSYITWVMNIRNIANSVSKELIAGTLTNYKEIQYVSDEQNIQFKEKQFKKAHQLLIDLGDQLSSVLSEGGQQDLVVLNELLNQTSTIAYYSSQERYQNFTQYVLYHVFMIYEIQWERITNGQSLPIYNYDQNFAKVSSILMNIQTLQTQQVDHLHQTILKQVNSFLYVISTLTVLMFIDIIVVFAFVQFESEKILKLFATYESEQIQEITDNAQESLKIFLRNLTIIKLNVPENKLSNNLKEITQLKKIQCQKKKKKISSTTSLSKFNIKLLITSIAIIIILIVQPITNILFTNQQIKQSEMDSKLLGEFELVRAIMITGQVIPYYFIDKIFYPKRNPNPESFYVKNLPRVFPLGSSSFKNLTDAIQVQRERNTHSKSEYENFFFKILIDDACTPTTEYNEYMFNEIDLEECRQLQQGIFKNGLLNGLQSFIDVFIRLKYILEIPDKQIRLTQMKEHFKQNTIQDIVKCYEIIITLFSSLKGFIIQKNQEFFAFIQEIQIILMNYQITMIVFSFFFFFFFLQYIKSMQQQLRHAILILSVFEINYIFANSYILNFLQQF